MVPRVGEGGGWPNRAWAVSSDPRNLWSLGRRLRNRLEVLYCAYDSALCHLLSGNSGLPIPVFLAVGVNYSGRSMSSSSCRLAQRKKKEKLCRAPLGLFENLLSPSAEDKFGLTN